MITIPPMSTKRLITSHHDIHCMMLKIQVLDWDRHKNIVGLNRLIGYNPNLLIIGSSKTIQIQTNVKHSAQIYLLTFYI